MDDIIDQMRLKSQCRTTTERGKRAVLPYHPARQRSDYDRLRLRLNAGLPGSVVLMVGVACLAPMYWHNTFYLISYIVVQLITVIRVMIAIQMHITIRHIDPSRPITEVVSYVEQLEALQKWNRRYTLRVKLPLTVCVVPLIGPPLGIDFFNIAWFWWGWLLLCAIVIPINAVFALTAFKKLEKTIDNIKKTLTENSQNGEQ